MEKTAGVLLIFQGFLKQNKTHAVISLGFLMPS